VNATFAGTLEILRRYDAGELTEFGLRHALWLHVHYFWMQNEEAR
jgi:hypothetical protein